MFVFLVSAPRNLRMSRDSNCCNCSAKWGKRWTFITVSVTVISLNGRCGICLHAASPKPGAVCVSALGAAVPAVRLSRRCGCPGAQLARRRSFRLGGNSERRWSRNAAERLLPSVALLAACSTGTLGVSRFEKAVTFPEKSDF